MAGESLRVTAGNASGTEITLGDEFLIGRSADAEGRLGDDPEISRQHAKITRRAGDQLAIEDLGSTNGTYVNGTRITAPQPLKAGDTIQVGKSTLQIADPAGRAPQATAFRTAPPAPAPAQPPAPVPARAPGTVPGQVPVGYGAPPPQPAPARSGGGPPVPLIALLGLLVVGAIVAAVVLLGGGDEEDDTAAKKNQPLTQRQIIDQGKRSTVNINTKGPAADEDGNKITAAGGGTGVVVDAARGLVLTNAHVVSGQTSIKAQVGTAGETSARVKGQAPCEDLAVIELAPKPEGLVNAKIGRTAGLRAGDKVTALGFPGAFEEDITERRLQATEGTVSSEVAEQSLGKNLPTLPAGLQHQAPISPGNSGGPLLNNRGEVVGINSVSAEGGGRQSQNVAISMDRAKGLLPDLTAGKDVGYVGWDLAIVDLSGTEYVFVESADSGSPADEANLVYGDVLTEVDGTKVETIPEVCDILGSKSPGDRVKVQGVSLGTTPARAFQVSVRLK